MLLQIFMRLLLLLIVLVVAINVYCYENLKLEQVVILSRHNVRTPLSKNLFEFTPKRWPTWKEKSGYLTAKGVLLEGFMGEFFLEWIKKEGLLDNRCPDENSFYVYANTAQRTMASAEAFISKAFPECNITIHHTSNSSNNDPIFNPIIHNSSQAFKTDAIEEMQVLLNSYHLNSSYKHLENILDYKDSKYCVIKQECDFLVDKNDIFVNVGFKPNLEGPLKISKSVIDSFLMENYEGFPLNEVAWGTLQTKNQWDSILDLTKSYHNIIFSTSLVARDVAKPLLIFMYDLFLNKKHKVSLLMAHDANIYTIINSMRFKPFTLKNQLEAAPAGGKLIFQKWLERSTKKYYAKVEYVYQSTEGMRSGKKLSLENPPEFTLLQLDGCVTDKNGFCLWDDFIVLLQGLITTL